MASMDKYAGGEYLKGEDIGSKRIPVTIESITPETLPAFKDGDPDEEKLVVRFAGKDKGMALCRTAVQELIALGLTDYEDIPDNLRQMILHTVPTNLGPSLRLASAGPAPDDDEVPF